MDLHTLVWILETAADKTITTEQDIATAYGFTHSDPVEAAVLNMFVVRAVLALRKLVEANKDTQ